MPTSHCLLESPIVAITLHNFVLVKEVRKRLFLCSEMMFLSPDFAQSCYNVTSTTSDATKEQNRSLWKHQKCGRTRSRTGNLLQLRYIQESR
ncbi:hypothetical protein BAUCODRAFT_561553 [Baudoinia panamericana UAMH 10762]|uniref:Uncharacterized protein n=1 Tax=Baudoinia panamericana (strain UAMH 10762) TaxID=717646 RepID=M2MTD4_BAUPA|nr:uncharacterized protein BAUCODRAFT_561553 [Baudoinia panamericana UAMH 10762]EMC94793.1 hypothetical protein BAUCODRAFT_561553 [Baudoinia panamericana UAMH 10762]